MDAVSCIAWIKRGVAQNNPDRIQLSKEEIDELYAEKVKELINPEGEENLNSSKTKKSNKLKTAKSSVKIDEDKEAVTDDGNQIDANGEQKKKTKKKKKKKLDKFCDNQNDNDSELEQTQEKSKESLKKKKKKSKKLSDDSEDHKKNKKKSKKLSETVNPTSCGSDEQEEEEEEDVSNEAPGSGSDDEGNSDGSEDSVLRDVDGLPVNTDPGKNLLNFAGVCLDTRKKDNYITNKFVDSDEEEDLKVLPSDNLMVVCRVTEDESTMEVYIYNRKSGSFYVHHDIMLSSYPLCLEWINFDPADATDGNMVALGTMDPDISIWDVDIIDVLEPAFVLAGSKKKKKKKTKLQGHRDAILDLSWNSIQKQVLASASADSVVGLWDLCQGTMSTVIDDHTEKVQTIEWHPFEPALILSGSADHTVRTFDCRHVNYTSKTWTLPSEVEKVIWNHKNPYQFVAGTDSGHIFGCDVRHTKPVFSFKAHRSEVTGLALSSDIPGCLFSSGFDGKLKLWDVRKNTPSLVLEKNCHVSEIYSMAACIDEQLTVGIGGERTVRVMDLNGDKHVKRHFGLHNKLSGATTFAPENEHYGSSDGEDE